MNANLDYDKIYEIRLRVGRPLFYTYDGGEGFLTDHDGKYVVTREGLSTGDRPVSATATPLSPVGRQRRRRQETRK